MRTRKRKIGLFVAVSIMAVGLLTPTAMAQVYTEPVGFVRVDVVRDGLSLISVPLTPGDNNLNGAAGCVGDMIKENLLGGPVASAADMLWKWDSATQTYNKAFLIAGWGEGYDGKWWDATAGGFSTVTLDVGEAFWIQRR